tara:strand:- start:334 stop:633 length:300 start_codon:yes stop_codon:yes gene_type:complete
MKNKHVSSIINEWYDAMGENKISVQPKATTLLNAILMKYEIKPLAHKTRDLWGEFLNCKAGDFESWYRSLTPEEVVEWEAKRKVASQNHDPREKQLLKD